MEQGGRAESTTPGEGVLEQNDNQDCQRGQAIFDGDKGIGPMVEVIIHHRIQFRGPPGKKDQREHRIQQAQTQNNDNTNKQGRAVEIQGYDLFVVIFAPAGLAPAIEKQPF